MSFETDSQTEPRFGKGCAQSRNGVTERPELGRDILRLLQQQALQKNRSGVDLNAATGQRVKLTALVQATIDRIDRQLHDVGVIALEYPVDLDPIIDRNSDLHRPAALPDLVHATPHGIAEGAEKVGGVVNEKTMHLLNLQVLQGLDETARDAIGRRIRTCRIRHLARLGDNREGTRFRGGTDDGLAIAIERGGVDQADTAGRGGSHDRARFVDGYPAGRIGDAIVDAELNGSQTEPRCAVRLRIAMVSC
ncbi:hypothetical protein VSX64_06140 [Aurantimonas sp. C2-6-R+9]|nr:hypothetical protein [Aurantimonas sp. C2-6-R+9]